MPMSITIVVTDDDYTADFAGDCAGIWGRYNGGRRFVNEWLAKPRSELEARWCEVALGGSPAWFDANGWDGLDDRDRATFRWIVEECPLIALAVMCAEWSTAS